MEPILEVKNISISFPGVLALDDVSMSFLPGEVHALVGENGAGKSTLIKALTGVNHLDSGEIFFDGKSYKGFSPSTAKKLGISVIYQELSLVSQLTVAENIFLSNLPRKGSLLDKKTMLQKTRDIFDNMGFDVDPKKLAGELTVGFQQMVELAKAIVEKSKILIMDEPTAPLSNFEVEILFKLVQQFRENGVTIIYISHRLEEIFQIADRVSVLRDGKMVGTKNITDTNKDKLIKLMVGRSIKDVYPKRDSNPDDEILLETKNLTGNGVSNISLQVKKGEVFGLGGLVGAGRTEFAQLLYGVKKAEHGEVFFKRKKLSLNHPKKAMQIGITLVPEDRKRQGLILGLSVQYNITMAVLKKLSKYLIVDRKKELDLADKYKENMRIKISSMQQVVKNLSGGNQQKVVVAKGLATEPELIIIDEPTRGIDVGAKQEIYHLMNNLIKEGKTIIMITSEMQELLGMSDRIAVFCEGKLSGILEKNEFNAERVLQYASKIES